MYSVSSIALLLSLSSVATATNAKTSSGYQGALIIQQDGTLDNATFSFLAGNDFEAVSELTFPYQRPYIEATATNKSTYYVVAFPSADLNGAAHLYELFASFNSLALTKEWTQPPGGLAFFDLQYSANQGLSAFFYI